MAPDNQIFLRNDDVRNNLDDELIRLSEICMRHKIPISHAVEPANVSKEVVEWLLMMKRKSPQLIEIIQHGYDHNIKNPHQKMEFGGSRTYEDQLKSMQAGKQLMDSWFGNKWSPVFTFPYGTFNKHSLDIVDKLGYIAISSKIDFTPRNIIKNRLGKILKRDFLMGKKISYHPDRRNNYNFKEISVSANLIKRYLDENTAMHYSNEEVLAQIRNAAKHTSKIGILFHHRFHTDELNKIDQLLKKLKEMYRFSTIMDLVR